MSRDFIDDRRRGLEEAFFAKHNEALLQRLREVEVSAFRRQAMAAASGITDETVLEKLISLNVSSETIAAISMVPLVAVAWADGSVDERERAAILAATVDAGLDEHGASYALLGQWLREPPRHELLAAWKTYIAAVAGTLDDAGRQALKDELLSQARGIAEAAGGFLGVGRRVSPAEEAVLKQLEATLP